jgi:hypothetical protein|tara:strand:- start:404 stop:550 length:147 start_codon:yes stop_codon:yes gene_type:complete
MVKQNKDMKKAFIETILGHFNKKDKPDFVKNMIKNKVKLKGKNVIQKK